MADAIPALAPWEDLLFNLGYVVPLALQGTFTRNPGWVGFWSRVHPDPSGVRFVAGLRHRHGDGLLGLHLGLKPAVLVLDAADVERVLDNSPTVYADPPAKRDGMQVFQPNAVTISRGDDWRDRRRFNEAVLDFGRPLHHEAATFLGVVREEVAATPRLERWEQFDDLFGRIMRRIVFGRAARDDAELTDRLRSLLRAANRPFRLGASRHFEPFYDRIRRYLAEPEAGSLAAACRAVPSSARTRVENQIPHWMFALWETLGTNVVRTLAAIVAHPAVQVRVRDELAGADLESPQAIGRLAYLEGCLQEAMRLWPTTPMLVREVVVPDRLGAAALPAGRQVVIWNAFHHRDRAAYPLADAFSPEAWSSGRPSAVFNQVSSGPQVCAGLSLLLFVGKAVVATALARGRYVLLEPDLDPAGPLPYAFDHFRLRLARRA